MKQKEPNCACWVFSCHLSIPKYARESGGRACGDVLTPSQSHALTWTHYRNFCISLPLVFSFQSLTSSGTSSTHTTLYLTNKEVICMFAVPNTAFQREICPGNLWTEISPQSKWIGDQRMPFNTVCYKQWWRQNCWSCTLLFNISHDNFCRLIHHFGPKWNI